MDLFQLREQFSKDGIMMCFNGPFSHSIIEEIGTAIRNHLAAEQMTPMAVQDVFAIYIEMTQNARNYLTLKNVSKVDAGSATIVIARQGESYIVTSGNIIRDEDMADLGHRIDTINALDRDALKKAIRRQLRNSTENGAQGAGIGLMEMAKRSTDKLIYTFKHIDSEYGFFTLIVRI